MTAKTTLRLLFTTILVSLVAMTVYATRMQSVLDWGGLTRGPDRYWTWATLMDAYFGFTTFYVWVFYKERRWSRRVVWFVAIMLLGNMAMASYVLWQLKRLRPGEDLTALLVTRHA